MGHTQVHAVVDPARRIKLGHGRDIMPPELLPATVQPVKALGLFLLVEILVEPAEGFIGLSGRRRPPVVRALLTQKARCKGQVVNTTAFFII